MKLLFDLADSLIKHNIRVILIQIDEAHSNSWPIAINKILNVEQPEPQKTLNDRIQRAQYFVDHYNPPYEVFIDTWCNDFAELFRAWPDKYHFINNKLELIAKSDYHTDEDKEAIVIEDCVDLLKRHI